MFGLIYIYFSKLCEVSDQGHYSPVLRGLRYSDIVLEVLEFKRYKLRKPGRQRIVEERVGRGDIISLFSDIKISDS